MVLRAAGPDDAPAVHAVLAARDLADLGIVDGTLADLLDRWGQSEFDLAADAIVVELDGAIVAYAEVYGPGALAAIAPGREGHGIGPRLLSWAEQRAREQGRDAHRQAIAASDHRAAGFLRAAGYQPERSYWRMVRKLGTVARTISMPAGFSYRAPDIDSDAAALHALDDACFRVVPDYRPHTLNAFSEEHLHVHDLDPGLSSVAERDGELVGFLLARRWVDEKVGFVDLLGVHPDHQHRGLGSALLLDAFARFAAAGLREAQLGVASDNPRAVTLYERVGMRPRFQVDTYIRPITGTGT
jgi:mycothiol synthase